MVFHFVALGVFALGKTFAGLYMGLRDGNLIASSSWSIPLTILIELFVLLLAWGLTKEKRWAFLPALLTCGAVFLFLCWDLLAADFKGNFLRAALLFCYGAALGYVIWQWRSRARKALPHSQREHRRGSHRA